MRPFAQLFGVWGILGQAVEGLAQWFPLCTCMAPTASLHLNGKEVFQWLDDPVCSFGSCRSDFTCTQSSVRVRTCSRVSTSAAACVHAVGLRRFRWQLFANSFTNSPNCKGCAHRVSGYRHFATDGNDGDHVCTDWEP